MWARLLSQRLGALATPGVQCLYELRGQTLSQKTKVEAGRGWDTCTIWCKSEPRLSFWYKRHSLTYSRATFSFFLFVVSQGPSL